MKCCQKTCEVTATQAVYWPGQGRKPMCLPHANLARQIANSMGFEVHVETINEPETSNPSQS